MLNLLAKIIHYKKTVFFVLLFSLFIFSVPQITRGAYFGLSNTYTFGAYDAISGSAKSVGEAALTTTLNGFIVAVAILLIVIFGSLSNISGGLLLAVLTMNTNELWSFTGFSNPVIAIGWPVVRDLANMIVVLGFIIIGIATALRIKEYEAKQLLVKLILAALLINFSLLICGIFIDGSNITTTYFLKGTGFLEKSAWDTIETQTNTIWKKASFKDMGTIIPTLSASVGIVFFDILLTVIFFAFFFLFLMRYIALWILVILSPFAFVCYVFPATRNIWNMWWTNFFQWCIIGIPAAFFIYLADKITAQMITPQQLSQGFLDSVATFMQYLVPVGFLIAGFLFSLKTSAMGASAAMSAAEWSKKKIQSGAKSISKTAADKTGITRQAQRAQDWAGQHLENAGLMKAGSTAARQQARFKNDKTRSERVDSMTAEQMKDYLNGPSRSGNNARMDRATMIKKLAANNQLGMITDNTRRNELINEALLPGSGVRSKDIITGMESGDIARIINNPEANQRFDAAARAEGFKTISKRGDLDLIRGNPPAGSTPAQIATETTRARRAAVAEAIQHGVRIEEIEKTDYHYAAQNDARKQRIQTANPTFTDAQVDDAAMNQALDETITSMSHEQLRNVDAGHLTAARVGRLTPDKINAFQYASQESRDTIKTHFNPASGELAADAEKAYKEYEDAVNRVDAKTGAPAPDTATATNRLTEYRRLLSLYNAITRLP